MFSSIIPTPKPPPDPQLNPGIILYQTQFDTQGTWGVGSKDSGLLTSQKSVINGKYLWDMTAKDGVITYSVPEETIEIPYEDYQISVDVHRLSGPADGAYGIIFDYVDRDNYWEWAVSEDGSSYLGALVAGDWQDPATQFDVPLKKGETNTLTIKVSKDLLYFYVNGALASSYENPNPATASFIQSKKNGLCAEVYNAGDKATIEFDNFVISIPANFKD